MKIIVIAILTFLFAMDLSAQVIFRNDFVINRKKHKIENLGLTHISINLQNYPNWHQLINGRGGRSLAIDVRAIRNPKREYTYTEIAEKIYVPTAFVGPSAHPVPLFLLLPPPHFKARMLPLSSN